jgi:medium-chain acyl-[acyl-carrier-protein] hydrolase
MSAGGDLWVRPSAPPPAPALRVFTFSHAGGGASAFNAWTTRLPKGAQLLRVQLPGREDNWERPPFTSAKELAPALFARVRGLLDVPFLFYGHSLGALISFVLAQEIRRAGLPLPKVLLVSGRRAPRLPLSHAAFHRLPDEELTAYVQAMGATPSKMLERAHWREPFFRTLRADLQISELFEWHEEPPLECPLVMFPAAADDTVKPFEAETWRTHTSARFELCPVSGGHFFDERGREAVIQQVSARIQRELESCSPSPKEGLR